MKYEDSVVLHHQHELQLLLLYPALLVDLRVCLLADVFAQMFCSLWKETVLYYIKPM